MSDPAGNISALEERIAIVQDNLRELLEQATGSSGAADEERLAARIAEQQALLERLTRQRDEGRRRSS
jgi:hypothetical protein